MCYACVCAKRMPVGDRSVLELGAPRTGIRHATDAGRACARWLSVAPSLTNRCRGSVPGVHVHTAAAADVQVSPNQGAQRSDAWAQVSAAACNTPSNCDAHDLTPHTLCWHAGAAPTSTCSGCAGFCFTIYALSELLSDESDHVTMIPVLASNVLSMSAAITLLLAKWRYDKLEDAAAHRQSPVAHASGVRYSKFTDHDDAAAGSSALGSVGAVRGSAQPATQPPGSPYVSPQLTTAASGGTSPTVVGDVVGSHGGARAGSFDFDDSGGALGDVQLTEVSVLRRASYSDAAAATGAGVGTVPVDNEADGLTRRSGGGLAHAGAEVDAA